MRPSFSPSVEQHRIEGVDDGGGSIVVTCRCGWRSAPGDGAGHACSEWDRHAEASADEPEA